MTPLPLHFFSFALLTSLALMPPASADPALAPAGVIKTDDLQRARANLETYDWARKYLSDLKGRVEPWMSRMTPAFLESFIPETTPGASLFTPCPSCRDKKLPYLPHGNWQWTVEKPDQLACVNCKEVYPSPRYPESIVIETQWGRPQQFRYIGGEPFQIFNYKHGRPSMTGNIRCRKVEWMTTMVRNTAELYLLSGDLRYAEMTRAILLRFADVYPYWLVHTGYGEIADMAPAVAAAAINRLPQPERVFPPNTPDRVLFSGYWQAGRARSEGMEGVFVRAVATAYDLTRGARRANGGELYTAEERRKIEGQLLTESVPLLISDQSINNKSMGNRSGVGLVGLILKQPEWVRFGLEGFRKTVDEWFLSDGGTPESPAYAQMALGGIVDFGQALRGYSDPEGYIDANGERFDRYNPYDEPQYQKVWAAMFSTLQGDLTYPPFADSYRSSGISTAFAELMAANYPDHLQYQALRRELLKTRPPHAPYALYYSTPGAEKQELPPLTLPSHVLPELRIGWMRTGDDGREALMMLSASHWGGHHHLDSLNLTYWNDGAELLSDLGYLWDHPQKEMTTRTLAHNTVLVDGQNQIATGRGGEVLDFIHHPQVKGMRAASQAYPQARRYERAATLVDHGQGQHYIIDVFWVEGGETQDYVYHGPNSAWSYARETTHEAEAEGVIARLQRWWRKLPQPEAHREYISATLSDGPSGLYDLTKVKQAPADTSERLQWKVNDGRIFSAWHLPAAGETTYIGEGWGQRDHRNADRGTTLPYIIRRTNGEGLKTFASVFSVSPEDAPFVQEIRPIAPPGGEPGVIALEVKTSAGSDLIVVAPEAGERQFQSPQGTLSTAGKLAVISLNGQKVRFHHTDSGKVHFRPGK